jgi:DNA mismatch repair protein MutS2
VGTRDTLIAKAYQALEWPLLLESLASHAVSPMGVENCRGLQPLASFEEADRALQETGEMRYVGRHGGLPLAHFPDLRLLVERASKGAALHAAEFRDISLVLGIASDVGRYLRVRQAETPRLSSLAEDLAPLESLRAAIDHSIDTEGNIRETATPELRALTHHATALKHKIRTRLDAILASSRFAPLLQEQYFAQRENRYVVPVKAERKAEVPGIVHDVSASGATVFIEPRELVDLNNQIKEADLAVEREVRRILQGLGEQVSAGHRALLTNLEILGRFDCLRAKARFADLLEATVPSLNAEGEISLKQARHPLLFLKHKGGVVANDVSLANPIRVLVISGPNAGGKTVTLKIVGLFALMVRAGLEIPCEAGSVMAFFPEIYAEIGDAQDLAKDLSSFSAHITDMIALLHEASPGSLVLLDEPVTSTDPAEGAALAEALLVHFAARGFTVVATTHYNPLKAAAQSNPAFQNASVGFDLETLSPTYRLIAGVPGGSSAIEIAGRLGMDETLLDDAVRLVNRQERAVELLMEELQRQRGKLDRDTHRIAELRAEMDAAAEAQKQLAARQLATEKEARQTVRKKLTEELLRARAEVQSVVDDLKTDRRLMKARDAKERLTAVQQAIQQRLVSRDDYRPLETLQPGDRVELLGLGKTGVLLESPAGKKRVRVRVRDTELSVECSRLAGVTDDTVEPTPRQKRSGLSARETRSDTPSVLDLRGKSSDEALSLLPQYLDQATLSEATTVRIIHGHGTGRLRQVLREYLKNAPYVAEYRSGERAEGGDGVTVVTLR